MSVKTDTELQTQRAEIESETTANANTAARVGQMLEDIIDSKATKEFSRSFVEALVFDKNEIFHAPITLSGDITFTIGAGSLVDQASSMRLRFTTDGTHQISFGTGFDFLYGITNGQIVEAGTYEIFFLYTNSSVSVNFPGVSSESSSAITLGSPNNFAAVADGETAIDLSWTNVSNNSGYLIEFSLTGTGGWTTLETTAVNATTSTQTALSAGDVRYYRIKTLGDGVDYLDSAYSDVISGQTESGGDVTAPTFTFAPASGVTDWTVNAPIVITANEPIRNTDGSEITNANVASRLTLKETNSGGANIAFTATIDGTKTIITVTPTTQYGENQLVYVAINNVEDVNGNEVTVAISSTFTTTDFTLMNGSSNRLIFGDILDSIFSATDTNFELLLTINDMTLTGLRPLVAKYSAVDNQRSFNWRALDDTVIFQFCHFVTGIRARQIEWADVLTTGEHDLRLTYDGSIDTNDGLDRVDLYIDGVLQGGKALTYSGEALDQIANSTAQLAVGAFISNSGTPAISSFLGAEVKDFLVKSTSGSVTEINVPNIRLGTDTSGNGHNGTWV